MDYLRKTGRKPILGTMTEDSRRRELGYMRKGCNAFDSRNPRSTPNAFWTREDVWTYIKKYNVKYCELYDQGTDRTGCMFCMFGLKFDGPENRFVKMRDTHPQHWKVCMNQLGYNKVLNILKMPTGLKIDDL